MNKICSLFIIIIIVYLSYDYCSNSLIEGQTTYDTKQDDVIVAEKCESAAGKSLPKFSRDMTDIKTNTTSTKPCQFESTSCISTMERVKSDDWGVNWHHSGTPLKRRCNLCVQGSKIDGNARHVLANVGVSKERPNDRSNFADDLCDAMVAGCGGSSLIYANNQQNGWRTDCMHIDETDWDDNKINKAMCTFLQNSTIQFFLGFMGGIECTLKIKAYQLRGNIQEAMDCTACKLNPTKSHADCVPFCK